MQSALSTYFRRGRDAALRALIARVPRQGEGLRILDLGGRANYWQRLGFDWLAGQGAKITLLNLSEAEFSPVDDAPEGLFENVIGNACALDFADGAFDLAHANSVIEHVGLWREMVAFAEETRRVGRAYYVQTPNFWFPVDPHFWKLPFLHWLPRPTRAMLLRALPLATAGRARDTGQAYAFTDSNVLLTRGQMRYLFPEAEIAAERVALLPKSYIAIHDGRAQLAKKMREPNHG